MSDYSKIRDKIQAGDLIACRHDKIESWYDFQVKAVMHGTGESYSHVCVAWPVGGRVYVIESVSPVVRIMPLSNMLSDGFYWIPLDKEMSNEEFEFLHSKVGIAKYSKWEAILAQFRKLHVGESEKWECAELTMVARKLSGVDLGDKATPGAVVLAAQKNYDVPVYYIDN